MVSAEIPAGQIMPCSTACPSADPSACGSNALMLRPGFTVREMTAFETAASLGLRDELQMWEGVRPCLSSLIGTPGFQSAPACRCDSMDV